ncbi:DUF7319 domain-containing protein [Halegenticoccus tardaugens]|uniref:DUF7319 domain-containing protein n=1 Tax=Halegenticoccus tardaugens TaxID=2071624 RepID=UPI00100B1A8B|nr:hypothetical protein [Halegenticoccus tardaugens]
MSDPSSTSAETPDDGPEDADGTATDADESAGADDELETLRRQVEEKYDFENFGPRDMAEMSLEEWEAVFDPDSWITGEELLDRVERDLTARIADRDVFAVLERIEEGGEERLVAYSDEGYAVVFPDGSVEGRGTVLRDVKPTVALCSMERYEVPEPPEDVSLPSPEEVAEGSGQLGNWMLQIVAAMQILAGFGLFAAWLGTDVDTIVAPVAGFLFFLVGLFLFLVVANARLSDRFRAEEYRNRLRAVGLEGGERPDFLPLSDDANAPDRDRRERETENR